MISIALDYYNPEQRHNNPNKQWPNKNDLLSFINGWANKFDPMMKEMNTFWNWINWTKLIYNVECNPQIQRVQCIMHINHNGNCVLTAMIHLKIVDIIIQPYRFLNTTKKRKTHHIAWKTYMQPMRIESHCKTNIFCFEISIQLKWRLNAFRTSWLLL